MSESMDHIADAGMLDLFRMEVQTHAAALETGLVQLESHGASPERIEPLMRAAHSIKGAARILGLTACVNLAHQAEDIFVAAQENRLVIDAGMIDQLLKVNDFFKRLGAVAAEKIPVWLEEHAPEITELQTRLAGIAAGRPAPPAAGAQRAPIDVTPSPASPPTGIAAEPTPEPETKPAAKPAEEPSVGDSAVLVTAATLNRLMGLAGECMVEARRLHDFSQALLKLKARQVQLGTLFERLQEAASHCGADPAARLALEEVTGKIGDCKELLGQTIDAFEAYSLRTEELTTRLYNAAIAARMRPFSDGTKGFPRLVRDLARQLGKQIAFHISGANTRVDRDVLARLEAPLNHILRNACDHGIEPPAERRAAGKPAEGQVRLAAEHRAGMLFISVSDDGRGADPEKIRAKVVEKRLAPADMAAHMSDAELLEFLFLPGFSTAEQVTDLSGRGVGMDVVQNMVQEVGGAVRMLSEPGRGSTVQMQLPLTLSVTRALIVEIGGELYAFHLARVDRVLKVARADVRLVEDRPYITCDQRHIGLIPAYQPLGLAAAAAPTGDRVPVVLISDRTTAYGLVVDRLVGERELVVRPLDARLGKVPDISAAAVLEDGAPVLILDEDDLVRTIDNLLGSGRVMKLRQARVQAAARPARRILVVDDSITVREVERRLLENRGFEVDTAVDGMDGWNRVRSAAYDLVISDVDMPRMNGIELVTRIKQDAALKRIPVMIISYKDREEDRLRGLEAGANYYLAKSSFQDEGLIQAVNELIGEG